MKCWLVGPLSIVCSCWAVQALGQAAKPGATGAFPNPEPPPAAQPLTAPPPAPTAPPTAPPTPDAPPDASPTDASPPDAAAAAPLPPPPKAAPPPPPAAATNYKEPRPPPPRDLDLRPIRLRRPSFIGGELGWNGQCGLCVIYSYHFIPHLALDSGIGLSVTGWRLGARVRANFLTSEWTPFLAAGASYATGWGDQGIEVTSRGETAKLQIMESPFLQLGGGVNYTGTEGFVFTGTLGASILLRKTNTKFVTGSTEAYDDIKGVYGGGLMLAVAFGYAF